jgi:hypothetical protein
MVGTLGKEPVSSGEPVRTTAAESPPKSAEALETENAGQSSKQTLKSQGVALVEMVRTHGYPQLAKCAEFLKRTRRVWLIAAGAILGVMAVVNLAERMSDRARLARERRHEQAVASVTPERLIARCGQPAEDVTKELYPILMRTISYRPTGSKSLLLKFTRTAEEKSDWVFLGMQDESGAASYDTPEAKIAALPCLDSKK